MVHFNILQLKKFNYFLLLNINKQQNINNTLTKNNKIFTYIYIL